MKQRIFVISLLLSVVSFISLLLTSCEQDALRTNIVNPNTVSATVYGEIIDTDGNPVAEATIDVAGNIVSSNSIGLFQIPTARLINDGLGTAIKVTKSGYFQGSTRIFPMDGSQNFVRIQLIEIDETVGSFSSTAGGLVSFDGVEIRFSPGSIVQENGAIFSGNVDVFAHWINPLAEHLEAIMPGQLLGLNAEDELVGLVSYGMIAVELQDQAGRPLQLAPGKPASLKMPVPNELLADAPTQIPLWSFNEDEIMWEEERFADLVDGNYIGEVSHFSFWSCDAPFTLVQICGQAVSDSGMPLVNELLIVEFSNSPSLSGYGYTDDMGFFCGKVPVDELLKLYVHNHRCNFDNAGIDIGPFSAETDIGTVIIPDNEAEQLIVNGRLLDCDMENLAGGMVKLELPNHVKYSLSNQDGLFSVSTNFCDGLPSPIQLQGFNLSESQASNPIEINSLPNPDELFTISVCDQSIAEFIDLSLDGQNARHVGIAHFSVDSCGLEKLAIQGNTVLPNGQEQTITIEFADLGEGVNDTDQIRVWRSNQSSSYWCRLTGPCVCNSMTLTITTDSGQVGTPIIGNFEGSILHLNSDIPISGGFSIIRQP